MGRESNFCYLDTMCVFCFQTKKGHQIINLGPLTGRQPRKTSRGKSSRNCPDINEPRCAGCEPQTVRGDRDSPRPNTSHPADSRTPGLGKHFPDLKSKADGENISNLREKPQSPRMPVATPDPDARVHTSMPPARRAPAPSALPPPTPAFPQPRPPSSLPAQCPLASSLRHPPICTSRRVPDRPDLRVGAPPPRPQPLPPPHPNPISLRLGRRTGNRPRARFSVRPGGAGPGGRGGAGVGDQAAFGSRPRAAAAARCSPGPGVAPGVLPQPPSLAERRRGHQHF